MRASGATSREVLRRWQRVTVRVLAIGFVLVAGTGVFLAGSDGASSAGAMALLLHVAVGVLLLPALLVL